MTGTGGRDQFADPAHRAHDDHQDHVDEDDRRGRHGHDDHDDHRDHDGHDVHDDHDEPGASCSPGVRAWGAVLDDVESLIARQRAALDAARDGGLNDFLDDGPHDGPHGGNDGAGGATVRLASLGFIAPAHLPPLPPALADRARRALEATAELRRRALELSRATRPVAPTARIERRRTVHALDRRA